MRFLPGEEKPMNSRLSHAGSPGTARRAVTSAAVFVLMAAGLLAGSAPAAASDVLGGIDMQRACNTQYYDAFHFRAVLLDRNDAGSWRCVKDSDTTNQIDLDLACMIQYGAGARSGLTFAWNPDSWYCRR
jgi:hypothetical protein